MTDIQNLSNNLPIITRSDVLGYGKPRQTVNQIYIITPHVKPMRNCRHKLLQNRFLSPPHHRDYVTD